ncbi:MAG TPA: glycosyltransferase family 39 protein, partial [Acidobacteriota bacterium]|nr:glycosyltransferase family 39 protein [Acidobacteriota bacterium]
MSRKPDPPEGKPDVTVGALPLITREAPKANGRSLLDNPKVSAIVLGLVVLAGIVPRTHHLGRSLWTAEAWLANSTLEDTLPHMFHYQNWLQTTPPLLLLLVRGTVKLFGLSEYSLRAVPFILGILALILVAALSFRAFRPPFAVVCTGLVAISPTAIYYSQVLKQYSGDMAAASLILLVLWRYGERGTTRRYVQVLLALTACLLFSYTSVMFIPLIIAFI